MAENFENEKEKKELSNKAKGVIAGSVAAGLTAVVAAVTIVSLTKPDPSNQPKTYSIQVSSEFEGFKDSDITVNAGIKIKDLKNLIICPIEGYEAIEFYKDANFSEKYDLETAITENMKVYIKFDLKKFTVTAFADTSKTQVLETVVVEYKNDAVLQTPTKAADKLAKSYVFAGWTDSMGRPVSITNIMANTEVFASFEVAEYVNYAVGELPTQVSVVKGSGETETTVATGDNLHYGDRVKIVCTPSTGHQMKTFIVSGAEVVDGAENWYEITGALSVTYSEEKIAYVVGELPKQVTILDAENNKVESGATLLYDDIITITYTPTAGYKMSEFEVAGAYPVEGLGAGENKYNVRGNITVTYAETVLVASEGFSFEEIEGGYKITKYSGTDTDVVIPGTYNGKPVKSIGCDTFRNCGVEITSATFLEGIETIEDGYTKMDYDVYMEAPYGLFVYINKSYENLKSVVLPKSLKYLGEYSFIPSIDTKIKYNGTFADWIAVDEGESNELYGNGNYNRDNFYIGNQKYSDLSNPSDGHLIIPEGVEKIGSNKFNGCKNLVSVTIPNSVTNIGDTAFQGCTGLTSITIPNSVKSIGYRVFYRCTGLTSVTILEGVTSIGSEAFSGCEGLTSITIPSTITSISNSAFYGCNNLQYNEYENALYLGNNENPYMVLMKVKDTNITSVQINENTKVIYYDFRNCTGLTSITISESVTSIGDRAFAACSSLTLVTIESADIYKAAIGSNINEAGGILNYATTVRVLATADDGTNTYLGDTSKYNKTTETIDGKTYNVYTKK